MNGRRALAWLAGGAVLAIVWLSWPFATALLLGALMGFTCQPLYVRLAARSRRPFLASLALILLFGRDGVASRWLDWSIYGAHGIVTAQVFTFLPQAWLLLAGMLGKIDTSLEEAAENLGTGPLGILRRITLALARPGALRMEDE